MLFFALCVLFLLHQSIFFLFSFAISPRILKPQTEAGEPPHILKQKGSTKSTFRFAELNFSLPLITATREKSPPSILSKNTTLFFLEKRSHKAAHNPIQGTAPTHTKSQNTTQETFVNDTKSKKKYVAF